MSVTKMLLSAGIVGVLAAQIFAILPRTPGNWYWPFLNYPMYSASKQPGTEFTFRRLETVACDAAGKRTVLADSTLGVKPFRFRNLMETAAGGRKDAARPTPEMIAEARASLTGLARRHLPADTCALEIVAQAFVVEKRGLVDRSPPWLAVARWPIDATSDAASRAEASR